jgi:hypothetical protein
MSEIESFWGTLFDLGALRCSRRNIDIVFSFGRDNCREVEDGTAKETVNSLPWKLEHSIGSCAGLLSALFFFFSAYWEQNASERAGS